MSSVGTDRVLRIRVLGSFSVTLDGQTIEDTAWQRRHARQLVKLLAVTPRHRLHRDVLMEQLWPESSQQKASNNLNKILYMARRALEPSLNSGAQSRFLRRSGEIIELVSDNGLLVDADHFEHVAKEALYQNNYDTLKNCAELYTGDLLEEDVFDQQLVHRREALARLYHQVLLNLSERASLDNEAEIAVDALSELLRIEALNEDYHRRLITLYRDQNQIAKAISQYERCKLILARELSQEPDHATQALLKTLTNRNQSPSEQRTVSSGAHVRVNGELTEHMERLAVLPLENTEDSDEFEYLSEGITENLIFSLSRLPGQRVLARSTVFRYKNQVTDPVALRTELSVNRVVMGRIAYHLGRVRIWIELVNTDDGILQWAQHYDREMQDILQLQNDIAVDLLAFFTSIPDAQHSPGAPDLQTVDAEAYHQYLKGRYHWNKRTGESLETALGYFRSALDYDPVYALAWSGLADTYSVMSLLTSAAPHDTMPKARAAAIRALEVDPQSCEAYTSLAYCQLSYDWHWADAESSFQRALELNPYYATARQWFHKLLVAQGRFMEAKKQIALAKQLDPLSLIINTEEGWGLYHSRQFPKAIQHLNQVLLDDPHFAMAHFIRGLAHTQASQFDLAIDDFQAAAAHQQTSSPFALQLGALGHAFGRAGQIADARHRLQELQSFDQATGSVAYASAMIHAGLDDNSAALASLELAFESRLDRLIFLRVEPIFDSLHGHPQFSLMCQKLGHLPTTS